MYDRPYKEIEGAIVALGGGATNNLNNVRIIQDGGTIQEIHLHFHIVENNPSLVTQITSAIKTALGGLTNGTAQTDMPTLPRKVKRD